MVGHFLAVRTVRCVFSATAQWGHLFVKPRKLPFVSQVTFSVKVTEKQGRLWGWLPGRDQVTGYQHYTSEMEAVCPSRTFVKTYETSRCHDSGNHSQNFYGHENINTYLLT
jgi:hypothetical protein